MYKDYFDVPWYRRSGPVGAVTFLGIFFAPAIILACIVALSGEVYTPEPDGHGGLHRWSWWNKAAAVVILIIQLVFTVAVLMGRFPLTRA